MTIVVDRKACLLLAALVALGAASGVLFSQQLTMTATYPIPAGVYNQIVTTGNSGTTPADTTLNRNAGNTIIVPPQNPNGFVGIGTLTPRSKLDIQGGGITIDNDRGYNMRNLVTGSADGTMYEYRDGSVRIDLNGANAISILPSHFVGVGTMAPASRLSVAGGVQLGDDTAACTASKAGTLRWNSSSGAAEVCDGAAWGSLGGAVSGTQGGDCPGWTPVFPATACSCWGGIYTFICEPTACAPGWVLNMQTYENGGYGAHLNRCYKQ